MLVVIAEASVRAAEEDSAAEPAAEPASIWPRQDYTGDLWSRRHSFGFGGAGIVPGRDRDTFGIGWYLNDLSDQLPRAIERRVEGGRGSRSSTTSRPCRGST